MPLTAKEKKALADKAREVREKIVKVTEKCGGSHVGGSLSQTDVLVALYHKVMTVDPKQPELADRDRFILSKGHGGVGHAVVLGDMGYFPEKELDDFNKTGSPFGMHLDMHKVRGVDASTGSLGHGLGIGLGMALGARLQGFGWQTYVMVGDGECNEGSIWEAAMAAAHFRIDNLTCFVDRNKLCIDGPTEEVMGLGDLAGKWRSFGWDVQEIDGHDFDQIVSSIEKARSVKGRPSVIICNTVKGKGVDFMENVTSWHYAGLDSEMAKKALASIRKAK